MESLRFLLFKLSWQTKRQLKRITPLTWCLIILLIADLLAPGYLKFNFLIARVDLSGVVDAYQRSED